MTDSASAERFTAYVEDSTIELPLARLAPRLLGALDAFLEEVARDHPEALEAVADHLSGRLSEAVPDDGPSHAAPIHPATIDSWQWETRFPQVYVAHGELLCGLLGVDRETLLAEGEVALSQRRFIRARYVPRYLMLLALSESIGREAAVTWMKRHLDDAIARLPSRADAPDSLEELRMSQVEFNLEEQGMDWVQQVHGPHQYANKVTRCRIHDVLSGYDPALMDVIACYPDFAMFRHTNPHFILTRTQTLIGGGACCDTCYHDDRYVEAFVHPTELFETMN